jgi:ATP-dependent DNA helicase RecQ
MPLRKELTELTMREQLGFSASRPGQEEAVKWVLERRDTIVVQPTGSRKSAVYQAAGLLIDGVTVVVSRSIALQKDQVNSVTAQPHTASTALVNSWLSATTVREKLDALTSGEL